MDPDIKIGWIIVLGFMIGVILFALVMRLRGLG